MKTDPVPSDGGITNVPGDDVRTAAAGVEVVGASGLVLDASGALGVAAVTQPGAVLVPSRVFAAERSFAAVVSVGPRAPPLTGDQPLLLPAYLGQGVRFGVPFVGDPGAGLRGE
ncbi:hypothetical protein PF007_g24184 [Phytophthora fragariae]|uniref:Uncharacterized protein n=1 Tax=Phytophthora fragariae TaxID=53985 RepID=A0A6A3QLF7_9STRA|nr:hypothetical protein PF003_g23916 [Phytophthora fragariae]KAE9077594.1 hypothetical protein PF007_g24184 [Phytophthora fragariae]